MLANSCPAVHAKEEMVKKGTSSVTNIKLIYIMFQKLKNIVEWKYFGSWMCDKREKAKQSDFKMEGTGSALLIRASMTKRVMCNPSPKHAHIQ